ncbi:MAG: DUF2683 family protein [Patescibacteria group bacterium]
MKKLRQEVAVLRRSVELNQTDPEGEYRPEFVEEILRTSKNPGKLTEFTNKEDFLKRVEAHRSQHLPSN